MDSPTDDIATLRAEVALARAKMAEDAATIARQNLEIAKLKRQLYGASLGARVAPPRSDGA